MLCGSTLFGRILMDILYRFRDRRVAIVGMCILLFVIFGEVSVKKIQE